MRARWLVVALFLPALSWADEFDGVQPLTTDQMAKIRAEQDTIKQDAIDNSKGDDSYDGIHAAKKEIRGSLDKSLEDNGVSKTQYMKEYSHADKDTKAEVDAKVKAIKEKTKADREAKAQKEDAEATDRAEHPYGHLDGDAEPAPKAHSDGDESPQVMKGYKDGDSVTIPSKVDANGEKTPEIILGFDEAHSPGATAPQKTEGGGDPAPVAVDPPQ